jgi:DNA topoisomerase-1
VKQQERKRNAQPPFITSTLQQEASRKLGFTSKRTMALAQQLYEGVETDGEHAGLITYMRSDSTRVSNEAQAEAREFITERYGAAFAPAKPNVYKTKGAAQDAHEAIRPTTVSRTPESLSGQLTPEQLKLYRLIWQRFVASQMTPAVFDVTTADIDAAGHTFRATGSVPKFEGFMKVYSEGKDTEEKSDEEQEPLPALKVGQMLDLLGLDPKQHFTEPPPRYTEATLVKTLAEKELGRPSTYATFISTIIDRGYAELKERKFYPTELGFTTNDLLVANFPEILDVGFTVDMEKKLDGVGDGEVNKVALLKEFYGPFDLQVNQAFDKVESLKPKAVETDYTCPTCGKPMVLRQGPRGPFLGCTGYPKCKTLLNVDEEGKPVEQESNITEHACPLCGKPMMKREGKRGPFLGCTGYPKCKGVVDLDEAGEPVAESLVVAEEPCAKCGKPMIRRMGKRGPFLGCSGYPKCRNIIDLPGEEGAAGAEGEATDGATTEMTCPNCGKPMAKKFAGRRPFMGCTGYPECKTTLSMTGAPMEARAKEEPQLTEYKCPNCGEPLALRKGRFGPFLGCTGYPKCKTIVKVGKDGKPVGLDSD